jgi:multiple sugar transport system permease protein
VATTNQLAAEAVPMAAANGGGSGRPVKINPARRRKQIAASLVMLAPFGVLLGALLGWPIVWTILLSLTNEQLTGPTALHHQYIGFANFQQLFASPDFTTSLIHSLAYLVGSAYIGQVGLGFALAFLLRTCSRPVQAAVGGVIVMSWIVPEIIAAFMWFALLGKSGVLQEALHAVGIPYSTILVSHPLLALDLANSWRGVAFSMMLFTAALATVPREIVEAATLDGASTFRRIIHVFIPFIKGSLLIDVVLVTLATLNDFTLIFALTGGGPGNASQVLSTYMYQIGFTEYRIAYGTAVSVVLLAVGVFLSIFYVRALRRS